jgi:hypothetical protein
VTELSPVKGNRVFSAMYQGHKVVVKANHYVAEEESFDIQQSTFVNYINEVASAAYFFEPYVKHDDDMTMTVSVSYWAQGYAPYELPPQEPYTWIFSERVVRTEAKWWSDFRGQSIAFKKAHPEVYDTYRKWDEVYNGW